MIGYLSSFTAETQRHRDYLCLCSMVQFLVLLSGVRTPKQILCASVPLWLPLMRHPLDFIEVYAFLVHIPQGRQLAQLRHRVAYVFDGVVDVFRRGVATDAEADRAVRQFVVAAQCP